MWIIALMFGGWLFLCHCNIRYRLGHYPSDELARWSWRLSRAVATAVWLWLLLWAVVWFSRFVIEGEFLLWLTTR